MFHATHKKLLKLDLLNEYWLQELLFIDHNHILSRNSLIAHSQANILLSLDLYSHLYDVWNQDHNWVRVDQLSQLYYYCFWKQLGPYFNNTDCDTLFKNHGNLFDDFKFQMGDNSVFSIKAPVAFRNSNNTVETTGLHVPSCGLGFRHHKDDYTNPKRARYLLGNVLLKNFYSVYDYDQ
jgi:hypothetical protein